MLSGPVELLLLAPFIASLSCHLRLLGGDLDLIPIQSTADLVDYFVLAVCPVDSAIDTFFVE
jgi:hypothetical protein